MASTITQIANILLHCRSSKSLESRFRSKDGSIAFGSISARVIFMGGKPHVISICRDITQQKRLHEERMAMESQLHQAQKMESVGRLAGGVAHDFNNMLGAILGHVGMAMEELEKENPLFHDLEQIQKAAERSVDLTRQLLTFARRQVVSPRVLDLNETLEGMLTMVRRLIGEDIMLAFHPEPDLWSIKVDPSQVDQIVANLCVNARDAIDEGTTDDLPEGKGRRREHRSGQGTIRIETANRIIGSDTSDPSFEILPGEYVSVSVTDNGCGMDRDIRDKLFEPFFTTKPAGKGTGLGLATVYGIVAQNKGFIEVDSEPGRGSTFRIYLPRQEGVVEHPGEKDSSEVPIGGHETILLVEDELSVLNVTTRMLEGLGYNVLSANTPGEAVRRAEEGHGVIELLLTDVIMPEINGHDLFRKLRAIIPGLRCLFMSGYPDDIIARHGVLDEGVAFLQKPFSVNQLADRVRKTLDEKHVSL